MKRKCKFFSALFSMAVMMLVASCNDSYPGMSYNPNPDDMPKNDEDDVLSHVPINIYTKDPGYFSLITRGTGAIDGDDADERKKQRVFYIYAFRTGTGPDASGGQGLLDYAPNLRASRYANIHYTGAIDQDNADCLLDGPDYWLGMPFVFIDPNNETGVPGKLEAQEKATDADGNEKAKVYYYSGAYEDVGYNFFGYYIDDFVPDETNTHRDRDRVVYDIRLDGYRDILQGYADSLKQADFEEKGRYDMKEYNLNLTDEERKKILSMYGGYSTYSAHRNINPIVNMKHQLARLSFQAYAADPSARDVTITQIAVEAPAVAHLCVAGRKYDAPHVEFEGMADFSVSEKADAPGGRYPGQLKKGGYTFDWLEEKSSIKEQREQNASVVQNVGSSLLLPPSAEYVVKITYVYKKEGTSETEQRVARYRVRPTVDVGDRQRRDTDGNLMFSDGVHYGIKIAVWGLQKIELSGTVQGWKTSDEDIEIDPDKEAFD